MKKAFLLLALFLVSTLSFAAMTTKYKVKGYRPSPPVKAEDGTWATTWLVLRDVETWNEEGKKATAQNADISITVTGPEADVRNNTKVKALVKKALTPVPMPKLTIIPE